MLLTLLLIDNGKPLPYIRFMPSSPDLSILIVNWNVADLLDKCLESIQHYTTGCTYEVIVVDNASTDDSVERVQKKYPWVKLIPATENLGFAKGNNIALAEATGRHIAYLNPDTELIEDAFTPLVLYLETHEKVGVAAPKLLNTDRTLQNSIGRFTCLNDLVREYFFRSKAEQQRTQHPEQPTLVDFALGACLIVRGTICREIGGFDERYFMYHEETDLCLTLREKGFQTIYDPLVSVIHHGSKSSTSSVENRQRTLHENRKSQYLFFQKHYGFVRAKLAKLIILLAMLARIIILELRQLLGRNEESSLKIHYFSQTVSWLLSH